MIKYTTKTLEELKVDAIGLVSSVVEDIDAYDFLDKYENAFNKTFIEYDNHYIYPIHILQHYQVDKSFSDYFLFLGDVVTYVPIQDEFHATIFLITKYSGDSNIDYAALFKALLKMEEYTKSSTVAFPYNLGSKEELDWRKVYLLIEAAFADKEVIIFDAPKQLVKKQNSLWSRIKRLFS